MSMTFQSYFFIHAFLESCESKRLLVFPDSIFLEYILELMQMLGHLNVDHNFFSRCLDRTFGHF